MLVILLLMRTVKHESYIRRKVLHVNKRNTPIDKWYGRT